MRRAEIIKLGERMDPDYRYMRDDGYILKCGDMYLGESRPRYCRSPWSGHQFQTTDPIWTAEESEAYHGHEPEAVLNYMAKHGEKCVPELGSPPDVVFYNDPAFGPFEITFDWSDHTEYTANYQRFYAQLPWVRYTFTKDSIGSKRWVLAMHSRYEKIIDRWRIAKTAWNAATRYIDSVGPVIDQWNDAYHPPEDPPHWFWWRVPNLALQKAALVEGLTAAKEGL